MKTKITPEEELRKLAAELESELLHWKAVHEYGCRDPFWPDGTNLNLTRNHCIADRLSIRELCEKHSLPLPDVYRLPIPEEVREDYMAPHGEFPDRLKAWPRMTEPEPELVAPMQLSF